MISVTELVQERKKYEEDVLPVINAILKAMTENSRSLKCSELIGYKDCFNATNENYQWWF